MGYGFYDLVTHIVALLSLPVLPLLWLTRHGAGLGERLGRVPEGVRRLDRPIWIHAASVGEVLSAAPLVAALRQSRPARQILVTTTSLTGRTTAAEQLRPDAVMQLPIDLRGIVGGALRTVRPRCLIIVETELWPGLLRGAATQGIPVAVVSGCISPATARFYARLPRLARAMLSHVRVFAMQSRDDAQRIVAVGARAADVHVVGSLKYARGAATDVPAAAALVAWVQGRPVVVAASTHPGEEDLAVDACQRLWPTHPDLLLIIAPRRPERFDAVAEHLRDRGVVMQRRSALEAAVDPPTQVLLLDSIGELAAIFPIVCAAFVGGTLVPVGGHNVLEPATFAKPVAFGPHTENVGDAAADLLAANAGQQIHDASELAAFWGDLLDHPRRAVALGERGRAVVAARADVVARTLALLAPNLDEELR